VQTCKAYETLVHTCYLILTKEGAVIPGKMNALSTSETNVLNAGKINNLPLLYVPSHTSCMFRLILLWGELYLELLPLTSLLV